MCRIAGIIDKQAQQITADAITMRDAMKHGGPDSAGIYADDEANLVLCHRRLSIIDLSDAGNQPMFSEDRDIVLVFNGEIYNYLELKEELQNAGAHFRTHTDTEVIIKAWQIWGNACFSRLKGMFALALYCKSKGELILARDHAGIKPLYYYCDGTSLYFASEVRAFKALKNKWKENEDWRTIFLTFGYLPEPATTLKGVHPLEKGSFRVFNIHTLQSVQQFFYQDDYQEEINDLEEAKHQIKTLLSNAVRRHLIADAPIGLFLSGGIDSSILTLLAREYKKDNLFTLSIDFDDEQFSEQYYQDLIVKKAHSSHHSFILDKKSFTDNFADILDAMDQPSADGINSYFICKYAKEYGLKAVLSGLGADELLGGYPSFKKAGFAEKAKYVPDFLFEAFNASSNDKLKKISFLRRKDAIGEYLFYRGYFVPAETARLLGTSTKEVNEVLSSITLPQYVNTLKGGNKVSYLESNLYMQGQLLKDTDTMSMWHSLEVRVPFLDHDFVKAVQHISSRLKYGEKQGKYLLIESFKDILPEEIWNRKKQGFVLPFRNWMKEDSVQATFHKNTEVTNQFYTGKIQWSRYWAYQLANLFN
jgi:asparagine synthase (glutamine-hydrolysing)